MGAGLIVVAVLVAFMPALAGQFVWDDVLLVDRNPLVTGKLSLFSVWFRTDFPLTLTILWLQWLAWGAHPAGYHIINVLLHAGGAVLLWRVLERLKVPGAWLGAVLFAVHPLCAASAAWVSEQKNTLSLVFYLLSALWYLKSETSLTNPEAPASDIKTQNLDSSLQHPASAALPGSTIQSPAYWLSLMFFALALLSKTSTVMIPVVLLGFAWWQRGRLTRPDVVRTIPFFALALGFGLMTVWFQQHQVLPGSSVPLETRGWLRLANAGLLVWFYLAKVIFPTHLNVIYPHWQVGLHAWVSLLLLVAVFGVFWYFRKSWGRPLLFAFGYFTVTLFPVLGFLDMYYFALSPAADQFSYLALIGITSLAGAALANAFPASRQLANVPISTLCAAPLVLLLMVLTFQRSRIMSHDLALWRDTLAKNPSAWTAHNNLGCILAEQNKLDDAIAHFNTVLQLNPSNGQAHCNLARALAAQGKLAEATAHFETALKLKPEDADVQKSVAAFLASQGKLDEALAHWKEALRIEPEVNTRMEYATMLFQTGNHKEAVAQYRVVLARKPDFLEPLNNLAWLLATSPDPAVRNGPEAVRAASHACRLTQWKSPVPLGTLAAAYAEAGRFAEAVSTAERSMAIASAANQPQIAAMNRQFLTYYRAGRAWHQPVKAPGAQPQTPDNRTH
jgi:tetratricopeptide (TPR) repeat protein